MRAMTPSLPARAILCAAIPCCVAGAGRAGKLVLDQPQWAGVSGFRTMWNESVPLADKATAAVEVLENGLRSVRF